MLVLSRHKNEAIVIGDREVVITVVDLRGDKVRLGIAAPADVAVHREEVFEALEREAEQSRRLAPTDRALHRRPGEAPG